VARRCVSYQADGRSEFNRRIRVMKRFGQQDEFFRERSGRDDADGTTQPYVLSRTSTNGYEVKLTIDTTIHQSTNESNRIYIEP